MILGHIDPKTGKWTKGPHQAKVSREASIHARGNRGFLIQMPPGWTDGRPGLKYVPKGQPGAGRVCFESRREAKEIAARYEGMSGERARYDPL